MAERQGIIVYFDLLETLKDFSDAEAGQLFRAMLEYGSTGAIPDFQDRAMRAVWTMAQSKIDRDNGRYLQTVEARQYAAYCREYRRKYKDCEPLSMSEWKQMISNSTNDNFDSQLKPELKPEPELKPKPELKPEHGTGLLRENHSSAEDPFAEAWEAARARNDVDEMVAINVLRSKYERKG